MRVALDFEGVCASTHEVALRNSDILKQKNFRSWNFITEEVKKEFITTVEEVLKENPIEVSKCEPNLEKYIKKMREKHTVEILTARQNCDTEIKKWFELRDIEIDGFTSTSKPKYEYDFDVYIDDNPNLVGKLERLYLRNWSWNKRIKTDGSTRRINSLKTPASNL